MKKGLPFRLHVPLSPFTRSSDSGETERRIGGLATTESEDLQGQAVIQRGLDFSYFEKRGWFTKEHSKDPEDIVGWGEKVRFVRKGTTLPDGKVAPADGHWVEGKLSKSKKADEIWDSMMGLEKAGAPRGLGLSLDGDIQEQSADKKRVIKANVRWIAITGKPVNPETTLSRLAKSIAAVEELGIEAVTAALHKALEAGSGDPAATPPAAGDGSPMRVEDVGCTKRGRRKKRLRKTDVIKALSERMPGANMEALGKMTDLIFKAAHGNGRAKR